MYANVALKRRKKELGGLRKKGKAQDGPMEWNGKASLLGEGIFSFRRVKGRKNQREGRKRGPRLQLR